jgi:hypothetical protein
VENVLFKRLWTCHEVNYVMNERMSGVFMNIHMIVVWKDYTQCIEITRKRNA